MILNSIVIENIRSYVHEEVEFPSGVSLFEGDIGSGKSTILMAIEFALFGSSSKTHEALLAKKESAGYVILEFSVDGRRYEIKRTLKRTDHGINQNPKETWIKTEGTKEPLSPSDLKQRILQILRFNESPDSKAVSRIFRYAIFTPQEAMKDVLFDAGKRLETIRKAFQIKEYSTAESNADVLSSYIKTEIRVMQEKFSNISELESQIEKANSTIAATGDAILKEQRRLKILEQDLADARTSLEQLQEKNQARIRLEYAIKNMVDRISDRTNSILQMKQAVASSESEMNRLNLEHERLSKIKKPDTEMSTAELTSEIKKFQGIEEDRIRIESEKRSLVSEISRIQGQLGSMDSDIESVSDTMESLQEEKRLCDECEQDIRKRLEDATSQKAKIQADKSTLEAEISRFVVLGDRCPTCAQIIDEQHSHAMVDEKREQVLELDRDLASSDALLSQLNSQLSENRQQQSSHDDEISRIRDVIRLIRERDEKRAKIPSIDSGIRMFNVKYSEFKGGDPIDVLTKLKDDLVQYENTTSQVRRIEDARQRAEDIIQQNREEMGSAASQISGWESELNQKRSDLESFGNVDDLILQKNTDLNRLQDDCGKVMSSIAVGEATINGEEERMEQDKARLAESKRWKSRHGHFSRFQEWLEYFFIPTTAQIEKQVMLSILQRFNETYHDWYSRLVDDPTKESSIDENFTPIVYQDGIDQDVAFLSGGEKTSIALAYRLTLNSLVREEGSIKSNLLILDEPTDGFSKDQLYKVRQILDDLKSEQIILVSHDPELETCADHVFRISKQDGISSVQSMSPG